MNARALPGIPQVHCVRVRSIIGRIQAELVAQVAALSFIQLLTCPQAVLRPLPFSRREITMLICQAKCHGVGYEYAQANPTDHRQCKGRAEPELCSSARAGSHLFDEDFLVFLRVSDNSSAYATSR